MSPFRQMRLEILLRAIFPGRLPNVDASTIAKGAVRAIDEMFLRLDMPQKREVLDCVFSPLFLEAITARLAAERHLEA